MFWVYIFLGLINVGLYRNHPNILSAFMMVWCWVAARAVYKVECHVPAKDD